MLVICGLLLTSVLDRIAYSICWLNLVPYGSARSKADDVYVRYPPSETQNSQKLSKLFLRTRRKAHCKVCNSQACSQEEFRPLPLDKLMLMPEILIPKKEKEVKSFCKMELNWRPERFTHPDGTPVQPVTTKSKSNGTLEMEYRSSTGELLVTRQIDNKGTQVLQFPDGSKETWYQDPAQPGSSIMIRSELDGSKRRGADHAAECIIQVQTNADGSTITSYPDGNKVQRMSNGIFITEHADRSTLQIDPDGREIRKWPDGRLEVRQPEGTVVLVDTDGCKRTAYNNGVTIESRKDGSKVQTNHDGSRIELARDQTKLISKPDGSRVTVFPDGTRLSFNKDGVRAPMSPAGPLPFTSIDFDEHAALVGCSSPNASNPSYLDSGASNTIRQFMEHGDQNGHPCSLLTAEEALHCREMVADLTTIRATLQTNP